MKDYIAAHKEELGIHEYAFLTTDKLSFSEGVRKLCESNACGLYNKTWACPPGVGTYEECRDKIMKYKNIFVFTTLHPLEDSYDFEGMTEGKIRHNQICPAIAELFEKEYDDLLILSAEGCDKCAVCTYPDAPCRFPDSLHPSIESFGVEVYKLAAAGNMHYINGANTVTYFGCIIY